MTLNTNIFFIIRKECSILLMVLNNLLHIIVEKTPETQGYTGNEISKKHWEAFEYAVN